MSYTLSKHLSEALASNQYTRVTHSYGLARWQAFTFEAWVRFDSIPTSGGPIQGIGTIGWNTIGAHFWYLDDGGTPTLFFYRHAWGINTTILKYAISLNTGQWYHLAVTKDGSNNGRMYIDGVQVGSTTAMGSSTGITKAVNSTIGGGYNNGSFMYPLDGDISLARIWGVARSQTEIADNMCNVFGAAETNMRAEYSLDNVYTDASGNGYTLIAVNSPVFANGTPSVCGGGGSPSPSPFAMFF